jgi:hypothetical protein
MERVLGRIGTKGKELVEIHAEQIAAGAATKISHQLHQAFVITAFHPRHSAKVQSAHGLMQNIISSRTGDRCSARGTSGWATRRSS